MVALEILVLAVLHEAAHAAAAAALGYRIRPVARLRPVRVAILVEFPAAPPAAAELLIAAAGPAASVALVAPLHLLGLDAAAVATFVIGVASLIPLPRSDGLRALRALGALARLLLPARPA